MLSKYVEQDRDGLPHYSNIGRINTILSPTSTADKQEVALTQIPATVTNFVEKSFIGLTCGYYANLSSMLQNDVKGLNNMGAADPKDQVITSSQKMVITVALITEFPISGEMETLNQGSPIQAKPSICLARTQPFTYPQS